MSTSPPVPRRGRPSLLTSDGILEAALALLDDGGLPGVSFRRLSQQLGVSTMTLYGYFASKDALVEALVARTISVPSMSASQADPWDAVVVEVMLEIHDALVLRPGIAELLISRQFSGDWVTRMRDQFLSLLIGAGFSRAAATDGISMLFSYLLGAVLIQVRRGRGGSDESFVTGLRYMVDGLRTALPGAAARPVRTHKSKPR